MNNVKDFLAKELVIGGALLVFLIGIPFVVDAAPRTCAPGSKMTSFDYGACIEEGGDLGDIFKPGSPGNLRWGYCQSIGSACEFPGNKPDQEIYNACEKYAGVLTGNAQAEKLEGCKKFLPAPTPLPPSPIETTKDCRDVSIAGLSSDKQRNQIFSCLGFKPQNSSTPGTKPGYCGSSSRGYYFDHLDAMDEEYNLNYKPGRPVRQRDAAYSERAKFYSCLGTPCEWYKTMTQEGIEEKILSCYGVKIEKEKPKQVPAITKPVGSTVGKPSPKPVPVPGKPVGTVGDGVGKGSVPGNSASLPPKITPAKTECIEAKGGRGGEKSDCLTPTPVPEKAISLTDAEQLIRERGEDEEIKEVIKIKVGNTEKSVAVIRGSDGVVRYSTNGRDWVDSLRLLTKPTVAEQVTSGWSNFWGYFSPGNLFHTADKDADREEIWQIGKRQLGDLRRVSKSDVLADRLKDAAGEWIKSQGESLTGKAGVSVKAVELLAGQLNNDRFAQALRIYINDRQAGKSSGNIAANPPPELLLSQMTDDSGNEIANAALYSVYEDSYQRFLLNKKLRALK